MTTELPTKNVYEELRDREIFSLSGDVTSIGGRVASGEQNTRFQLNKRTHRYKELNDIYGTVKLSVFEPLKEHKDLDGGGTILYTESHKEPNGTHELSRLFNRAKKIARMITDGPYGICPYCGWLSVEDWNTTKTLPIFTRNSLKRFIPESDGCSGLTSVLPPQVTQYDHRKDENPFFDESELEEVDTLTTTRGYPSWKYRSKLSPDNEFLYRRLSEEYPEAIAVDSFIEILDSLSREGDSVDIVDYGRLTFT